MTLLGYLALGAALGIPFGAWLAWRRRPAAAPAVHDPDDTAQRLLEVAQRYASTLAEQRALLVDTLVEVRDLITSEALRERIATGLHAVGVAEEVVDAGVPFDPDAHQAVERLDTDDPALDGLVALTDRCGYHDGSTRLRPPQVVVFRHRPQDVGAA